jgi:hypothetical protein
MLSYQQIKYNELKQDPVKYAEFLRKRKNYYLHKRSDELPPPPPPKKEPNFIVYFD